MTTETHIDEERMSRFLDWIFLNFRYRFAEEIARKFLLDEEGELKGNTHPVQIAFTISEGSDYALWTDLQIDDKKYSWDYIDNYWVEEN